MWWNTSGSTCQRFCPGNEGSFLFRGRQLAFISRTRSRQDLSDICQIRAYQTRASTTNRERTKSCTRTRLPIYASFSSFVYRTLSLSLSLVFTFVFVVVHDKSEKDQRNQIRQPLLYTQVAQTCTDMFYAQFICICRTAKLDATVCLACVRRQLHQSMPTPQSVGDSYKLWLIDWCDAFASAKSTPPTRHLCTVIVQSLNLSSSRHKYALDTPRRKLLTRQVHKFI